MPSIEGMKRGCIITIICLTLLALGGCSSEGITEQVTINGFNQQRVVNVLDSPVDLWVNGMNHEISVSERTDLRELHVNGDNIIINLSQVHSPKIFENGNNIKINYK